MRWLPTLLVTACATTVPAGEPNPTPRIEVQPAPREPPTLFPWFRSWDGNAERARLARAGDVRALEAEYTAACGPGVSHRIIGSPLLRFRTSSWNTSTGVVINLSTLAGPPETLLAELRCHLVGMALAPFGMDDCPFDLEGLHIDARGDETGIQLIVTVRDPALVFELQHRLAKKIEQTTREPHDD